MVKKYGHTFILIQFIIFGIIISFVLQITRVESGHVPAVLMVLRKDRPPCGVEQNSQTMSSSGSSSNSNNSTNEQPVTKRQRLLNGNVDTEAAAAQPPDLSTVPSTSTTTTTGAATSTSNTSGNAQNNNNKNGDASSASDEPDNVQTLSAAAASERILELTAAKDTVDADLLAFQQNLLKQCLCGVSEQTLKRPFQSHYTIGPNGQQRIATLSEWPAAKLRQFLSNLQLLFDVYIKQDRAGSMCGSIKDICDVQLIEHNLITEIIDLSDYNNKYVQYLAGRVMSTFLVIAQYSPYANDWLKRLVDNLFSFDVLNTNATRKITFSLEIFKRIVEWNDEIEHPLDEDEEQGDDGGGIDHSSSYAQHHQPPIENNYFHFYADYEVNGGSNGGGSSGVIPEMQRTHSTSSSSQVVSNRTSSSSDSMCHLMRSDYDSCNTRKLKCDTVKIIENKWPALLRNMNILIASYRGGGQYNETMILTFLDLWKSIISVPNNLSVNDTHPFHAQLDHFEELHLNAQLPPTVYKQMLTLFNEALCYGSTLSLQDIIPDETCNLAHRIIKHIKDDTANGLLQSVPVRLTENPVGLIGYAGRSIAASSSSPPPLPSADSSYYYCEDTDAMDKTYLQKMVLLVLKSVAVTVREMRSDSSDSSIDSSDYQVYSDWIVIETNIRNVLKKLDVYTKNKLQLHPEHHFSKMLVYLFDDQDDYLIEAMVCTLDVTAGFTIRTATAFSAENPFGELIRLLNPVYTFLEFLNMISKSWALLLDLLVSNETCFLLYLLRFLKYVTKDWDQFVDSCTEFGVIVGHADVGAEVMRVLRELRREITKMVTSEKGFPYDISPIVRLLETCENLHDG